MASFTNIGRSSFSRLHSCISLTRGLSSARKIQPQRSGVRYLYDNAALGIDAYCFQRDLAAIQFQNLQDKFWGRMREVLNAERNNMIFTEDLKNALCLAQPNEDDISLVIAMAKKFNSQHKGLRFGEFTFGPVMMRMFHHLNQPDAALEALMVEELEGFFTQITSYQIALNLLYKNGRYQDALDVFENLQEQRLNGLKYPKSCLTLAFACCYKMNSEESYKIMIEIFEDLEEYGSDINLRCIAFGAALALKQNNAHIALELLSRAHKTRFAAVGNLKVLTLAELGKVEDAIPIFRSLLQIDIPVTHIRRDGLTFLKETIAKAEAAVKEISNKELTSEFQHILKGLEEHNLISEKTLDEVLCEPVQPMKPNKVRNQNRAMLAASFNRTSKNPKLNQISNRRRVGLMDME